MNGLALLSSEPRSTATGVAESTSSATPEVPDWVTETPDETEYWLGIRQPDADMEQLIDDITRDEYIALKAHLAKMRGYTKE